MDRWVEGVSSDDRIRDVAARTLQGRLGAVLHYLPLAADRAEEDVEYVHHLRVWARRATAALRLYTDLIPRRRFSWMTKQLRRIRHAANDARDCDVLIGRLKQKSTRPGRERWLEATCAERTEAQKAIVAIYDRLWRNHRFARRIDKLLYRVRTRGALAAATTTVRFGDWARGRLRPFVDQFFGAIPSDQTDEAALHQFRIRGKELRYVMELLAGAFPDQLRTQLYPMVEALQEQLGDINDHGTAKARLLQKIDAASDSAEADCWQRLLVREQAHLDQAREKFWQWCTPQMLQDLRGGLEAILVGPSPAEKLRNDPPPAAAFDQLGVGQRAEVTAMLRPLGTPAE